MYLLTISLAKEKDLTLIYDLTIFSKHKDWHSFDISTSPFSIMLHHKLFKREEIKSSYTILSTYRRPRRVILSLFVCFLKTNSDNSAMLVTHEWRGQTQPLDSERMYWYASVDLLIDDIKVSISLFLVEFHLEQFLLFWYIHRIT